MKVLGLVCVLMLGGIVPSQASTVNLQFDNPPFGHQVESGYAFDNSAAYNTGGVLLLHDDIGGQKKTVFSQVTGGLFDAVSVDMLGIQRLFMAVSSLAGPTIGNAIPFKNFQWTGYRNGKQVATSTGSLSGGSILSYLFSTAFSGLSSLELTLLTPGVRHTMIMGGLTQPVAGMPFCHDYCSSVSIDNLVLRDVLPSAVPVPAGGLLLLSALGFAGFAKRRRTGGVQA